MKHKPILYSGMLCLALSVTPFPVSAQQPQSNSPQQEQQVMVLSGTITDAETSERLIGANIYPEKQKGGGTVTNVQGQFRLTVPKGTQAILISYVGYETQRIDLRRLKNPSNLRIRLVPNSQITQEVVVTGIQKRSTESFTGEYVRVSGDDLLKRNPNNLLMALQQFDPSFRVMENQEMGSDPNSMPEFRIRGDVQLGNNGAGLERDAQQMQMFINGYANIPNMPLFVLDGFQVSIETIMNLEPERISEVVILKDAAATAIYGSKASNGVVVFETKKPLAGRLRFTYANNIGVTYPDLTDFNLMNAEEKLETEWKAGFFHTDNAEQMNTYNRYRRYIEEGVDTYWLSQPLRTAITQRHTLSAEGGDDAFRYRLSASDMYMPGVMKGSSRDNKSLSLTLTYRYGKLNISNQTRVNSTTTKESPYGQFSRYAQLNPYYPIRDEEGKYTNILDSKAIAVGRSRINIYNPLYNTQFPNKEEGEIFTFSNQLSLEYAFLPNLRLMGEVSFSRGTSSRDKFVSPNNAEFISYGVADIVRKGSYTKMNGTTTGITGNVSLSYNLTLGKHMLTTFARAELSDNRGESMTLVARGYPNDSMDEYLFGLDKKSTVPSGNDSKNRSIGLIGQVGYMYDMRYSVDFSLRGDQASSFGSSEGLAPFWSVGTRWNVHKEKWFPTTLASNLVLRASYGVTGSQNYESYQGMQTYTYDEFSDPYKSSDVIGAVLRGIGNDRLGWSQTRNTNVGIELSTLKNRLRLSYNYYYNYTDQLLVDFTLSPSVGFSSMTENAGALLNTGHQANISYTILENPRRRFQWMISANGTHNKNVIKKISNNLAKQNAENLAKTDTPLPIYQEGQSTTQIMTVPSLGIDPATGKEIYRKRNGNKTFIWDAADKVPLGDSTPFYTGTVSNSVVWKDFSFSIGCMFNIDSDQYNSTLVNKIENVNLAYNADKRALTERWTPNNRSALYKALTITGSETKQSSRFLQNVNEFRISSINLSYRLDGTRLTLLDRLYIRYMNVGMTMQDIARFSNIKLERGTNYPFARTINFNLSIMFK